MYLPKISVKRCGILAHVYELFNAISLGMKFKYCPLERVLIETRSKQLQDNG